MSPFLTDDEIAAITRPLKQGAARIKFIRDTLGLPVRPRPDGQPLVRRADVGGVKVGAAANEPRAAARDWTDFENRVRYGRGPKTKRRQPAPA